MRRRRAFLPLLLALLPFRPLAAEDPPDHFAGIAVVASSVGRGQQVEDLLALVAEGRIRHVVVDWAWITAHWDRTDFAAVEELAKRLQASGVNVTAMYRPRFFAGEQAKIGVAVQVDAEGKATSGEGHREICFSDAKARAWGAKWAEEILRNCPSFGEVTVYNPRNHCECAACAGAKAKDPRAAWNATRVFLEEVRAGMRRVRKDAKLGAVMNPAPSWYEAMRDVVDVARPYLFLRDGADFEADMAGAAECRAKAREAGPALAKITWGEGDNVSAERLEEFVKLAREKKLPYCFWTFDTTFLEGIHDVDRLCRALGLDAARVKPILSRLGGKGLGAVPVDAKEVDAAIAEAKKLRGAEAGAAWGKIADRFGEAAVAKSAAVLADASEDGEVRWMAAWALGRIGSAKANAALLDGTRESYWAIRLYCVEALGRTGRGDAKVRERLEDLAKRDPWSMTDPNTKKESFPVRDAALDALKALDAPPPPRGNGGEAPRAGAWKAPAACAHLPWSGTLEDAFARARLHQRPLAVVVVPFEGVAFEAGYEGAEKVHGFLGPPPPDLDAASLRETGFVKERAILAALFGDPRNASLVSRRFVPVRLRLATLHFLAVGPSPLDDPLVALGTTCASAGVPSVVFASPDGKLLHQISRMGVFSPAMFHRAARAVLRKNPALAAFDEDAKKAVDASAARPNDGSLKRAMVEELLASGELELALEELDRISRASSDWTVVARAEIDLLGDDPASAEKRLKAAAVPENARPWKAAVHGDALLRLGRAEEARKVLEGASGAAAAYFLGIAEDRLGRRREALALWTAVAKDAAAPGWSDRAALRMSERGPFLEEWESDEPLGAAELAGATESAQARPDAVTAAVDYLLRQQRPDGSWRDPSFGTHPLEGPGGDFDKTVPRTGLAVCALKDWLPKLEGERAKRAREAIARGAAVVDDWSNTPRAEVWQLTYALHYELRAHADAQGAAKEAAARRCGKIIASLGTIEADGGWSYVQGGRRLHTFNTAPILILLAQAKKQGLDVDGERIRRAAAFLEKNRVGKKSVFHYGTTMEMHTTAEDPRNSSMRGPLCELALFQAGAHRDLALVRDALDLFFKHAADVRRTAKTYESFFDPSIKHDAYHNCFGCWYAARAIRLLPADERGKLAGRLEALLLPAQELDGSFVDAQMQGKSASTALTLLALHEIAESRK